ncbi:hypothetical protein Ddye_012631 [Dipteronia dyeriana]|uniref:Uncharacterized protein n=1 Tax=Dipteronia dyeriana TaxID=168575 RepID=A0AAD9X4T4_9ROSI|nr:hypothetical protein Ddye_012631 [Dipteronia dyeriana]
MTFSIHSSPPRSLTIKPSSTASKTTKTPPPFTRAPSTLFEQGRHILVLIERFGLVRDVEDQTGLIKDMVGEQAGVVAMKETQAGPTLVKALLVWCRSRCLSRQLAIPLLIQMFVLHLQE